MNLSDICKLVFGVKEGEKPPSLDDSLLKYDKVLLENPYQVKWDESSVDRHTFAGEGNPMDGLKLGQIIELFPQLAKVEMLTFEKSVRLSKKYKANPRTTAKSEEIDELRNFLLEKGADAVSFAKITPDIIFKGKAITYANAIVFTMKMRNEKVNTAPSFDCMVEVQRTYADMGKLANDLTVFMRKKGFGAVPGPALGGAVDYPSLAEKANLGAFGRHGLLISEQNGACQRIAAVFTSIENLNSQGTGEYDWVYSFCQSCGKCIKKCPAKAIRNTSAERMNGHKSCINGDLCLDYFSNHFGCSVCIRECPFTNTPYKKIKEAYYRKLSGNDSENKI